MRTAVHLEPAEVGDFADEIGRIFLELGRTFGMESLASECSPTLDLYETDDSLEIRVDLPGVAPTAVRVVAKQSAVLIIGEKVPRRSRGDSSFHLVERGFGRFARIVSLPAACDARRGRAVLAAGELRVSFPKVAERRGRGIPITVESA